MLGPPVCVMIDRRKTIFPCPCLPNSREAAMKSFNPLFTFLCVLTFHLAASAQAAEISGPQVGDQITPFTARVFLDDEAGKNIALVKGAAGKPLVIFFVHER